MQIINSADSGNNLPYLEIITQITNKPVSVVTNVSRMGSISATNYVNVSIALVTNITLGITKSVSNISFGGVNILRPIPGATVIYRISYTNEGDANAANAMVYDALQAFAKYDTNYLLPPTTAWTAQFSTNINPGQNYGSGDYSTAYTSKTNIKWVRWKKASVAIGEKGIFIYKVIIK